MIAEDIMNAIGTTPLAGVRFNVIKRTQHRQGKKETKQDFIDRVAGIIQKNPEEWFMRWNVLITPDDIQRFRTTCLDPILESITDDYEWWADCKTNGKVDGFDVWDNKVRSETFPHHQLRQFRMPFGCFSPLLDGGENDLDGYLRTGSELGLTYVSNLFPELQE